MYVGPSKSLGYMSSAQDVDDDNNGISVYQIGVIDAPQCMVYPELDSYQFSADMQPWADASYLEAGNVVSNDSPLAAWILGNLMPSRGNCIQRSFLYICYVSHCRGTRTAAVSPALFGKVLKSLFPLVGTRRLGTRGNSRYNYTGIKVKENSQALLSEAFSEYSKLNCKDGVWMHGYTDASREADGNKHVNINESFKLKNIRDNTMISSADGSNAIHMSFFDTIADIQEKLSNEMKKESMSATDKRSEDTIGRSFEDHKEDDACNKLLHSYRLACMAIVQLIANDHIDKETNFPDCYSAKRGESFEDSILGSPGRDSLSSPMFISEMLRCNCVMLEAIVQILCTRFAQVDSVEILGEMNCVKVTMTESILKFSRRLGLELFKRTMSLTRAFEKALDRIATMHGLHARINRDIQDNPSLETAIHLHISDILEARLENDIIRVDGQFLNYAAIIARDIKWMLGRSLDEWIARVTVHYDKLVAMCDMHTEQMQIGAELGLVWGMYSSEMLKLTSVFNHSMLTWTIAIASIISSIIEHVATSRGSVWQHMTYIELLSVENREDRLPEFRRTGEKPTSEPEHCADNRTEQAGDLNELVLEVDQPQ